MILSSSCNFISKRVLLVVVVALTNSILVHRGFDRESSKIKVSTRTYTPSIDFWVSATRKWNSNYFFANCTSFPAKPQRLFFSFQQRESRYRSTSYHGDVVVAERRVAAADDGSIRHQLDPAAQTNVFPCKSIATAAATTTAISSTTSAAATTLLSNQTDDHAKNKPSYLQVL